MNLLNITWFQMGWWTLVLTANRGWMGLGLLSTAFLLALHFKFFSKNRQFDLLTISSCALFGLSGDFLLFKLGILKLPQNTEVFPPWLLAIWILFPVTLNYSMAWSLRSPLYFPGLALMAALTYRAGEAFNLLKFAEPLWQSFAVVSFFWWGYFYLFRLALRKVKNRMSQSAIN